MSEVSNLMNEVLIQFNNKIKEIYDKVLTEHQNNISCNLCDGYTENYGKVEDYKTFERISMNGNKRTYNFDINRMQKYISSFNRYIIHILDIKGCPQPGQLWDITTVYVSTVHGIDNYGDSLYYNYSHNNGSCIDAKDYKYSHIAKYILPNILIDAIKNEGNNKLPMSLLKIVAKDYYQRSIEYKSLYQSGKLLEYNKLLECGDVVSKIEYKKLLDCIDINNKNHRKEIVKNNILRDENETLTTSLKKENDILRDENETLRDENKTLRDESETLTASLKKENDILRDENETLTALLRDEIETLRDKIETLTALFRKSIIKSKYE